MGSDGVLQKRYEGRSNEDLARYQSEMDADPQLLRRLVETPDTFVRNVVLYTFREARIIEKLCEEPRWPNVTYDGELVYANMFSTDKQEIVLRAKTEAECEVRLRQQTIAQAERDLDEARQMLARIQKDLAALDEAYPDETAY